MAVLHELIEPGLQLADLADGDTVEVAVDRREDAQDLLFDLERLILRLLQDLDEALAAIELRLRPFVEIAAELREGRQLAVLRQVQTGEPATCRIALICAEPPTRETELPTLIAGRTPWLKRSDSRNICPSVIEMTLVGMYADRSPPAFR